MLFGGILILAGLGLMVLGARRLLTWQGAGDDASGEADWYDASAARGASDPKYPLLTFLGTILGPILFGAILVVFGLLEWKWN